MYIKCTRCQHYDRIGECEAYPDGIPVEIITGEHDHTEPFPGDNGIRFEAIQDVAEDTN